MNAIDNSTTLSTTRNRIQEVAKNTFAVKTAYTEMI